MILLLAPFLSLIAVAVSAAATIVGVLARMSRRRHGRRHAPIVAVPEAVRPEAGRSRAVPTATASL